MPGEPERTSSAVAHTYDARYAEHPPDAWALSDPAEADALVRLVEHHRQRLAGPRPQKAACLDIGCALGCITNAFARLGYDATGIDFSEVAIEKAKAAAEGGAKFLVMDAFRPEFGREFDLILCRGFSGCNTHDMSSVVDFIEMYQPLLSPGGVFALVYSSNFSGREVGGEIANWTRPTLDAVIGGVEAAAVLGPVFYYAKAHRLPRWLLKAAKHLLGRRHNFCVFFKR